MLTLLVCIRLWHCSDVPFFTTVIAYSLSYPYGISEQKCELMLLDLHCYLNVIGPSRQMLTKAKVKVPCFKEGLMGEDPFLSYTFQLAMDKSRRTHGQCAKDLLFPLTVKWLHVHLILLHGDCGICSLTNVSPLLTGGI